MGRERRDDRIRKRYAWTVGLLGAALMAGLGTGGCSSRYKKLSSGGSAMDVLVYDLLGQDREPRYYYDLLRRSHDESTWCYNCGADPFLVDKNIDAVERLGDASITRIEGQAQVVSLLVDMLVEDRSALARAAAARSLGKIAARLPNHPPPQVPDRGERFLALLQELDALHAPNGQGRPTTPGARARMAQIVTQIGDLRLEDFTASKSAARFFWSRPFLIQEAEPTMRATIDTAVARRTDSLIAQALRAAVEDPVPEVRRDAIIALQTLGDVTAADAVIERLEREPNWLVRLEAVEYLGIVGSGPAAATLIPLLDDPEASVRHKSRQALVRIAGQDLGMRRETWAAWARNRWPDLPLPDAAPRGSTLIPTAVPPRR
jgi:hypothetical protein